MEKLETQITILTDKVEIISHAIERLNAKLSLLEPQSSLPPPEKQPNHREVISIHHAYSEGLSNRPILNHKDVLVDDDYHSHRDLPESMSDTDLSPELQIQRLTAQLTAAYNRIAALEEQLLSKRVHLP